MSNFFHARFFNICASPHIISPAITPLPLRGPSFSKFQPFPTFTLVSFSFSRFLLLSTGLVTSIKPYRFSPLPLPSPYIFSTLLLQEFFTLLHPCETTFFPSFLPPSLGAQRVQLDKCVPRASNPIQTHPSRKIR